MDSDFDEMNFEKEVNFYMKKKKIKDYFKGLGVHFFNFEIYKNSI